MSFEDSDMYQAILDGDLAALGCSVRELDDLNLRDSSGKSYLHICIELGQHDLVEYLAQRVFLGFRDDHGLTALDLAVRYRMVEVERQLVRRVAGMQDSDDTEGLQALFHAGWRAWPPLRPQEEGQEEPLSPGHRCQLDILQRQKQVDRVHSAVQDGELGQLQAAVARDESLVTVADHTGLPPLHKAVLFEWLSLAQYLSRTFPHTVNHTDHMGRTALHYAAAYHEYQDNILYKQLVRAGAMQAVTDLMGLTPTDIVLQPCLLSIEVMREEVRCRRSRPPKDYSSNMSYEESRSLTGTHTVASTTTRSMRRWRAIASVASFATNTQRKISRFKPFEETDLYEAIITNDIRHVRHALSQGVDVSQHSVEGWSYLHLAVAHHVSPPLMSLLLTQLSPAERDCDGVSPLEMCLRRRQGDRLARVFVDLVVGLVLADDVAALQGLVHDGWQVWPGEDYVARVLQSHVTPRMTQFLDSLQHFMSSVSEAHKAAILHQELDIDLTPLLDTEAGVTCLDSVGLALPHVCVIFYNIQLLTRVLRAFPVAANLKDSMGRTPLHYAAGLDDDDYMYSLLRAASARDDQEDLWGMRPGDYMTQRQRIVSPAIQETIRDKLYNPLSLAPSWPYCLLSTVPQFIAVKERQRRVEQCLKSQEAPCR
ncbi:serine/threonine-protein phosphatase 6 regulatory ankyrin repeat subunit B-like [Littorina saxatilis]|uniref:serine/threonine-protein phosphatase 6 regulatory ankyrin repeat subunit B-like n=1 Tax=Littorina saxatilis TaxID=31220 RepID=UPI0038B505D0